MKNYRYGIDKILRIKQRWEKMNIERIDKMVDIKYNRLYKV